MIGIIYGALVAMAQTDIKKLVAYSSVATSGFVMLGLFALNAQGVEGAILQMVNHGLSTGALFLLVGMIYERRHTREIADFGGLARPMPVYAAFFLIVMLRSIGLPGLNGFVGEFLILLGAFHATAVIGGDRDLRRGPRRGLHALDVPAHVLRARSRTREPRLVDLGAREMPGARCAGALSSGSASNRRPSPIRWIAR